MTAPTADRVLKLLADAPGVHTLDITGGAPELNANFRRLVRGARALGRNVIDRCNLTVLFEPGQADLVQFLADQQVEVVSSLPCYTADNVDRQRGKGVFELSMDGLRLLNAAGYGQAGSGLTLNLVYNPGGAFLPPAQAGLQADYKRRLSEDHGIVFDSLFTITNMPIARFATSLQQRGEARTYERLLLDSFNPGTVAGLMCRNQLSIGWDGRIFDCDFNQMLEMTCAAADGGPTPASIWHIGHLHDLARTPIRTADHCLGCTAGAGSSCGGALG